MKTRREATALPLYENLFHKYRGFALSVFNQTRNHYRLPFTSTEDATQDLYLTLWERLLRLPIEEALDPPDLRPFLIRSLQGSVLDSYRSENTFRYAPELFAQVPAAYDEFLHALSYDPFPWYCARELLARPLPHDEFTLLRELFFHETSYKDIARILQISPKQVYSLRLISTMRFR